MAGVAVLPSSLNTQMQLDPRYTLAQMALKQGMDSSPAKGGWGEAIARALTGTIGGYEAKSVKDDYANKANDIANIMSGITPGAPDASNPAAAALSGGAPGAVLPPPEAAPAAASPMPGQPPMNMAAAALSPPPVASPQVAPPSAPVGAPGPAPMAAPTQSPAAPLSPQVPAAAAGPITPSQKLMAIANRLQSVDPDTAQTLRAKALELDASQAGDMAKLGMQRNADGSVSSIPGFASVTGEQEGAKAGAHEAIDTRVNAARARAEAQYKPTTVYVNGQERIVPSTALADGTAGAPAAGAPSGVTGEPTAAAGGAAPAPAALPGFAGKPLPLTPMGTSIGDEAQAAGKLNQQLDVVEHIVGQITPGAFANNKYNAIKGVNSALSTIGLPQIDPDKVASAEELNKIVIQMASNATKQLGSREAAQVFEKQIAAQPGIGMTQGGAQGIINTMRMTNQRSLDQADAYGKYGFQNEATFRPQFEKENPSNNYSQKALAAYNPYLDNATLPPAAAQAAQAALAAGHSKIEIGQMLKAKGYK